MTAGEIRNVLMLACLAIGGACTAGPQTSVAIAVLNLEETPRRLVKVCLAKHCTRVNAVLEHGDEAIVTVQPRDDAPLAFTVEERGGTRVLPCDVSLTAGLTGSLQVAFSQGKAKVLENKLQMARASR